MRKKLIAILMTAAVSMFMLCGCGTETKTIKDASFEVSSSYEETYKNKEDYINGVGWLAESVTYSSVKEDGYVKAAYSNFDSPGYGELVQDAFYTETGSQDIVTREKATVSGYQATRLKYSFADQETKYELIVNGPNGIYRFLTDDPYILDSVPFGK